MIRSPLKRKSPLRKVGRARIDRKGLASLVRQICLLRDGNRCVRCGAEKKPGRGGGLQAAHIFPQGSNPSLRFMTENVVTLCAACHIYGPEAWHRDPLNAVAWAEKHLGEKKWRALQIMRNFHKQGVRKAFDAEATRLYLEDELARMRQPKPERTAS